MTHHEQALVEALEEIQRAECGTIPCTCAQSFVVIARKALTAYRALPTPALDPATIEACAQEAFSWDIDWSVGIPENLCKLGLRIRSLASTPPDADTHLEQTNQALFITGQHPTCPACESLVLPTGRCVNGCEPRKDRP